VDFRDVCRTAAERVQDGYVGRRRAEKELLAVGD